MSGRLNSKHNFLNLWDEYLESGVDNATFVVSVQIGRFGIDLGIAIHPSSITDWLSWFPRKASQEDADNV